MVIVVSCFVFFEVKIASGHCKILCQHRFKLLVANVWPCAIVVY